MSGDEERIQDLLLAEEAGRADGIAGIPDPNADEVLQGELREAYLKGFAQGQQEVGFVSILETVE